jgi:hypothetical protein
MILLLRLRRGAVLRLLRRMVIRTRLLLRPRMILRLRLWMRCLLIRRA